MIVLIRGGGDLASGVAVRLHRCGLKIAITELAQPLVVRRTVSFAEAIYSGSITVEGVQGRFVKGPQETKRILADGHISVLIDPEARAISLLNPLVLIDARMTKQRPELDIHSAPLVIGLGPGFVVGENCHAVIETNRGHALGRVIWTGSAEGDTGIPEKVGEWRSERVLRAPVDGKLTNHKAIGDHVEKDQIIADVSGQTIHAPFKGILRGLLYPGTRVVQGMKVGDIDPRDNPDYINMISDKALAVGGGVLEAILTKVEYRSRLWS
jgi:xanthine dehydrogenase accessory factor